MFWNIWNIKRVIKILNKARASLAEGQPNAKTAECDCYSRME